MIFDSKNECLQRDIMEQFQLERLQALISRLKRNVPFYRKIFNQSGEMESLTDLKKLPLLDRSGLTKHYPYNLFCVPLRDVIRLQTIYGLGLEPIVIGFTKNDINHWTQLSARMLAASGVNPDDMIMIANKYDISPASLGIHYAAEYIGATAIPCSTFTGEQIRILRDYHITAVATNIRSVQHLTFEMDKRKIDSNSLFLKSILIGEEPWTEQERQEIQSNLGVGVFGFYGPNEIGKVVAFECEHKQGLHIQEDSYIVEIIDPKTGEIMGDNEKGELVITTLSHEAYPLIRFRTGDITTIIREPCKCGRTSIRIQPVMEQIDNKISVNGITVDLSQIEVLIKRLDKDIEFSTRLNRKEELDNLQILIFMNSSIFQKGVSGLNHLSQAIRSSISEHLHIDPHILFVEK